MYTPLAAFIINSIIHNAKVFSTLIRSNQSQKNVNRMPAPLETADLVRHRALVHQLATVSPLILVARALLGPLLHLRFYFRDGFFITAAGVAAATTAAAVAAAVVAAATATAVAADRPVGE